MPGQEIPAFLMASANSPDATCITQVVINKSMINNKCFMYSVHTTMLPCGGLQYFAYIL